MVVAVKQVEFEDRLKEFRAERLGMVIAGEVPVRMEEGARAVLHIVPQSAFESGAVVDLRAVERGRDFLWPIGGGNHGLTRYNFDGLLRTTSGDEYAYSYVQLFHNGIVEAANSSLLKKRPDKPVIVSRTFEQEVRKLVGNALSLLREHGIESPLHVMLSLLRVKGYRMALNASEHGGSYPIDRDELLVPAVALSSFEDDVDKVMLPAFNRIWNASGVAGSPNYDESGNWLER